MFGVLSILLGKLNRADRTKHLDFYGMHLKNIDFFAKERVICNRPGILFKAESRFPSVKLNGKILDYLRLSTDNF